LWLLRQWLLRQLYSKRFQAKLHTGSEVNQPLKVLAAVEAANEVQKQILPTRIKGYLAKI